jgi:hypothetical protein
MKFNQNPVVSKRRRWTDRWAVMHSFEIQLYLMVGHVIPFCITRATNVMLEVTQHVTCCRVSSKGREPDYELQTVLAHVTRLPLTHLAVVTTDWHRNIRGCIQKFPD